MNAFQLKNTILMRNCIILHLLVGCFASLLADFHKNYENSLQANNADKFSRLISLGVAYQTKQTLTSK